MLLRWRTAARSLLRRAGLTLTIVVTLALGIGANSAIFSAVDAVLLKPLPYPDADRLVSVYERNLASPTATQLVAPGRLEEWNRMNRTFVGLAASYFENMTDTSGALPERVEAMRTSPRFFSVLGVPPALGRTPTADEERFGGSAVAVISDAFWRRRLNADAGAIGRSLTLGGIARTIVAVMPPSFRYPTATTEMWLPTQAAAMLLQARQARFYTAVGRLKAGVTVSDAERDLSDVQARLGEEYPQTDTGWGAALVPLKEEQVGGVRRSLWLLLGAVALVLIAACGNVACLLMALATRRRHEFAVRLALGAGRRTVAADLLREGALLAAAGTAFGLLIAWWALAVLRSSAVPWPRVGELALDLRLATFTFIVGSITTLAFAAAPAMHAATRNPADALSRGGRGGAGGPRAFQRVLVSGQVALAIVLLVGAGLLVRSFLRLQEISPGVDPDHVLTFRMSAQWSERLDAVVQRHARTIQRLEHVPGIVAAAISQARPAAADFPPGEFHIMGRSDTEKTFANGRSVSATYFQTLRIPILRGSTCDRQPTMPPVTQAVVSASFVSKFFPDSDPIGHALTASGFPVGQAVAIIGVVADVRERGMLNGADPVIYWCGYSPYWPDPYFIVRTDAANPASVGSIRAALREIEPARAVYSVRPLDDLLADTLGARRLTTVLLSAFAILAVSLAAMGLFGVLSQLVAARSREIGVRVALGARSAHIIGAVVTEAAVMTLSGVVLGLAGALALSRSMSTLLFGVATDDAVTFVGVPVVLSVVATATALLPARRAARTDPIAALRVT